MNVQRSGILTWMVAALLMLAVPNLLFWVLAQKVYFIRGIFVLEYFMLACLYPYISRRLFVILWILLTLYDMVFATTSMFFMDFLEILHALVELPKVSIGNILLWIGVAALIAGIAWLLLRVLIRHNEKVSFLHPKFVLPLLCLCFVFDFLNGQGLMRRWSPRWFHIETNIVSAPSWSFVNSIYLSVVKPKVQEKSPASYLGSVAHKVFKQDSTQHTKQLLLLVESWGLLTNTGLHQEVLQPIYDLAKQSSYTIEEGTTPFKYLTQAGELREITGYVLHHYQANDLFNKKYSLFFQKQQQGYHVVGIHGFSSGFYERQKIWPSLGVQEMYFADKLRAEGLPQCGNQYFMGICDTAIGSWLFNYMKQQPNRKEFLYWLTLNTHLPIEQEDDDSLRTFAKRWAGQKIPHEVLQLAYHHKMFFASLARRLADPASPKVHILLVGDHAPPFVQLAQRKLYDENLVPYVNIVPNK